jgi:hypothetical protein
MHRPNGHNIYQRLSLQDTPKLTQIWIFGLKIYHVATLRLQVRKNKGGHFFLLPLAHSSFSAKAAFQGITTLKAI